jgi:peptide/nickel transport system substrate-binding protein
LSGLETEVFQYPVEPGRTERRPAMIPLVNRAVMTIRALVIVSFLVGGSSLLAGEKGPRYGGSIRVGIDGTIPAVNPFKARYRQHFSYNRLYAEGLVDLNQKAEIVPGLAESWEISRDGSEYTFKVRERVLFHNGEPLTAEDVKWSLEYAMDPKNAAWYRANLSSVKSVEVEGPFSVKVRLNGPFVPFLSEIYGIFIPIASRKASATLDSLPIGSGPFSVAEWTPGLHLRLRGFKNYWKKGKPYLDEVTLRFLSDETVRFTALRTGDVDIADELPLHAVAEMKKSPLPGIRIVGIPGGSYMQTTLNTRRPPLNDVRLRQAIAYALDKEEILKADRWGFGEAVNQLFPKSSPWYVEVEDRKRDLDRARKLLAEAGLPQGISLPILVSPKYLSTAQVMQTQLKAVGINLDFQQMDDATRLARTNSADFTMDLRGVGFPLDPHQALSMFYSKLGRRNTSGYVNPEFDRRYEQAQVEQSFRKRRELYGEATKLVVKDVPAILLWSSDSFVGWRDHVQGFDLNIVRIPVYEGGGIEHTWLAK